MYTDGACSGNPGPGGWAWALGADDFASGYGGSSTTNQRMEITAAFRAVEALPGPLEVRSDSTYVVKCFTDRWHEGWRRRGWRNSQRQAVANRDLWEPFVDLVLARGDVRFTWVKAHAGDPLNELVDRLAVAAAGGDPRCGGVGEKGTASERSVARPGPAAQVSGPAPAVEQGSLF